MISYIIVLCLIGLAAHARIQADDMTSDIVLSQNCKGEETEVTRDHLVNLAMVKAFIAENNQLGLTASSVFSKAQDVNVPKFDFFEHRYHEFLTTDQKTNLKLNKMVEASKRQEQVFQNIAEPFIKDSEENASWLTSSPSVGDIVVNISLIFGTEVFIRLIFNVKGFGAIIAVNAVAKGVESTKLDSSIHGMIHSGEQYENLDAPACVPSADVVFVGVICMLLLVAIFGLIVFRLCWKWMKGVDFSHAGKIHLYLHIYDQMHLEQVSIFVQSIDFSRDLTVRNPKDLHHRIIVYNPSCLTTILKVTPELEVFDDEGNSTVFFTSGITLPYIKARKIKRMFKRGNCKTVFFLSYGGHLLNLHSMVRNRCPVYNDTSFCFENE